LLLTDNYTEMESGVFLRSDSISELKKVDSIVLDIDGVVLDVTESFRVAISKTTQYYFSGILGWNGKALLVSPAETQYFKRAGGFNNDWELTYAAVLFFLAKSIKFDNYNLDFLKNRGKSVKEFTKEIAAQGGGLKGAEKALLFTLKSEQVQRIKELWDKAKIKRIFQELYAGVDYCKQLYGFNPEYVREQGLLNQEKVLLEADNLKSFSPKIGILTGRTNEEAQIALEFAGLNTMVSPKALIADDGNLTKPDPRILLQIGKSLDTEVGIYIGDTIDDFKTVANLQNMRPEEKKTDLLFLSGIIAGRELDREMFLNLKADIVTDDPNKTLKILSELKKGG